MRPGYPGAFFHAAKNQISIEKAGKMDYNEEEKSIFTKSRDDPKKNAVR